MTKADRIEDLDDNLWIDMITCLTDRFDGWSPKLGVFPVRLAGPKEIKAGLVPFQVRAIEQQLFNSLGWMKIAKETGTSGFGIHVARQKVLDLHKERIGDWSVCLASASYLQEVKLIYAGSSRSRPLSSRARNDLLNLKLSYLHSPTTP